MATNKKNNKKNTKQKVQDTKQKIYKMSESVSKDTKKKFSEISDSVSSNFSKIKSKIENTDIKNTSIQDNAFVAAAVSWIVGIILDMVLPLNFLSGDARIFLGVALFIVSGGSFAYSYKEFNNKNESFFKLNNPKKLVDSGLYKYSRNPAYFSLLSMGGSIGLASNNVWMILTQVVLFFLMDRKIIPKEEKMFEKTLGNQYLEYLKKVKRWF